MDTTQDHLRTARNAFLLRIVLRYVGTVTLLAAVAVFIPYEWMNTAHKAMGLGVLPQEPVVGYLARTLSAFYALLGGLLWTASFDVQRHRLVLIYLGAAFCVFGGVAAWVDVEQGMPTVWRIIEAPIVIVFGLVILWLSRRLPR